MEIDRAARAIREDGLVVYPTETVYGLGADALNGAAIERVFTVKRRSHTKPLSMAVPGVETATKYTTLTARERTFIETFLPGPVTVLVETGPEIPDELIAGGDRVGIRIPDHDLARSLLREVAPITATSANRSGNPSVRRVADLDPAVREAVDCIVDGGELSGTESTVVDVERGEIHRRGALAFEIEAWLA
jgi:L-threonylcarbamoyladenylate synthase